MTVSPLQGLKSFAASQPPLLVFTICILAFGVTTIMLAFIVRMNDLPNPDIENDYNKFLTHLFQLDMCVDIDNTTRHEKMISLVSSSKIRLTVSNSTNNANASLTPSEPPLGEMSLSELIPDISQLQSSNDKNPYVNLTKHVMLPLKFGPELLNLPSSARWLKGSVNGRQLGFLGKSSKQTLSVSIFIPSHNRKAFAEKCRQDKNNCELQLNVCLLFFGPSNLFPKTREPQKCSAGKLGKSRKPVNIGFHRSGTLEKYCKGKTPLKMEYSERPDYTVMLSPSERSLVNLHLMHTSYFIFVIVVTMLCYALVRSHFRTTKIMASSEKVNV